MLKLIEVLTKLAETHPEGWRFDIHLMNCIEGNYAENPNELFREMNLIELEILLAETFKEVTK